MWYKQNFTYLCDVLLISDDDSMPDLCIAVVVGKYDVIDAKENSEQSVRCVPGNRSLFDVDWKELFFDLLLKALHLWTEPRRDHAGINSRATVAKVVCLHHSLVVFCGQIADIVRRIG